MRFSLCNEVIGELSLERQCELAARLGYHGLEVAPFTLSDEPDRITSAEAARIRSTVESFGLVVTGLHWLLVKPSGLSVTDPDPSMRQRTLDVMTRLVGLCAELGGTVLVHGSPQQRRIPPGETHAVALQRLEDAMQRIARVAESHDVVYCLEPLGRSETPLVNTVADAAALVESIGSPHLRTMIDCSAAGSTESVSVPALIDRWLPTGVVAHIQVNDPNRRAPGQGSMRFAPILEALERQRYGGVVSVEPFDYVPDGPGCAAYAIGYLRGLAESLDEAPTIPAATIEAPSRIGD